jgi:hypothetical protein
LEIVLFEKPLPEVNWNLKVAQFSSREHKKKEMEKGRTELLNQLKGGP